MGNLASEKLLQAVAVAKESASKAEAEFDRRNSDIQRKASKSIDLFGGDAKKRVIELARDSRRACEELYATYQALIPMLDNLCRPLLGDHPSADAVNAVQKMIKWLNDESEIENNYSASLNSHELGEVFTAKYIPSMENKIIQKFWEQTFHAMPESKEILEREKEERRKEEKAKENARKFVSELKRQSREVTTLSKEEHQASSGSSQEEITRLEKVIKDIQKHISSLKTALKKEEQELHDLHEEIDTVSIFRYIPLRKSIPSNSISSSYKLTADRGALKIIGSQMEKYHKENDLDSVLELYTILAQRGVRFDQRGNYLSGWYSFPTWVYEEARKYGTPIESRGDPYIDAAYEYHGYKIAFYETYDGDGCRAFELFVPDDPYDDGWCYIDFSHKDFGNIIYHAQNGGIMID